MKPPLSRNHVARALVVCCLLLLLAGDASAQEPQVPTAPTGDPNMNRQMTQFQPGQGPIQFSPPTFPGPAGRQEPQFPGPIEGPAGDPNMNRQMTQFQPGQGPIQFSPPTFPGPGPITPLPNPFPAGRMLGVYGQAIFLTNGQRALMVTGTVPNSAAARENLEYGDILVQGNGYAIQSHDNLRWIVQNTGSPLNLLIINVRTGQYQNMSVNY